MDSTYTQATANRTTLFLRALGWLAFLGPTFFILYGFTNEYTATRDDVGQLVFAWESHIPFWDWSIIPYMSIDLLYGISLFLCTCKAELDRHSLRLFAATVISVICFLFYPLQFTLTRPETYGLYGTLYDLLTSLDKPYNQAPSLHISLLVLIWVRFYQHIHHVIPRLLTHSWMFLIGISVLTTWQHHFIDIIGGLIVAIALLYLIQEQPFRWHWETAKSPKLARLYLTGSLLFILLALAFGGWGYLLLWPAIATALIAAAYTGLGVSVFQYRDQRMSIPAMILLAPYLLGAKLSAAILSRKRPGCVEITTGVWLGRAPTKNDIQHSTALSILNVTAEMKPLANPTGQYYRTPMLDLVCPDIEHLEQAVQQLDQLNRSGHCVLVHCALGLSRSAVVIAGWLLTTDSTRSVIQAVDMIQKAQPDCVLKPAHINLLQKFKERSL
ncbi:phosphatase PAP2/dual specificity phosphatase family protein [Amphritea balenae]|uniref:Phosphatase PAP2 family protein n=1 Tax=Amphritea balenae TaxID=452629 RepID=A0A3P1SPQ4_9GAMM|nr:phosphatase PAP2/dual specificity phosphatase family protein [Amphritea balenae]RRC98625.1 phosphatase PAP2 family protein [Amphritea balenae]GGK66066.1 hypothetical protein GCM10007941_15330 [Amphritea balenae]